MTDFAAIDALFGKRHIDDIDQHFAVTLAGLAQGEKTKSGQAPNGQHSGDSDKLALAAAILSRHTRDGHSCIDLKKIAGRAWPETARGEADKLMLPTLDEWLEPLIASPSVARSEEAGSRPLVLDAGNRLYLNRMWRRERLVAERLRGLAEREIAETGDLEAALDELFKAGEPSKLPRQAAHIAASHHLCCISGGPGTGKTHTVARIIKALMNSGQVKVSDIAFSAPTGKAAARLQESTRESLRQMHGGQTLPEELAVEVGTIHRWLMKSAAERGLAKVLIIDEASMVDIQLMSRVLEALPIDARLILLGDSHQLASVQPGSVFADICHAAGGEDSPLENRVVNLEHNWRFKETSGIGRLAVAIKSGDAAAVAAALDNPDDESIGFENLEGAAALDNLAKRFTREHYAPMLRKFRSLASAEQLAAESDHPFQRFMALCSHRLGSFGSQRFNARVEQQLRKLGLIPSGEAFYIGRPVIVTRNDHRGGLANGDAGIVIRDGGDGAGKAKVWFPDLREPDGGKRLVNPQRLPPHESFYALTVHRSQGSEYGEVAVIPGPAESRVNTRELLYTAVTRAKKKVVIHGARAALTAATERKTSRGSGLEGALL